MKKFKAYITEVLGREDLNASTKHVAMSAFGDINVGTKIDVTGMQRLFAKKDNQVFKQKAEDGIDIFVVDKNGIVIIELILKNHGAMFYVDSALSVSKDYKVHELYRDLLIKNVIGGLVTGEQSVGGRAIWDKLSKFRDVEVYGWDPFHRQAINLGDTLPDYEETHVSSSDKTKDVDTNLIRRMQLVAIKK